LTEQRPPRVFISYSHDTFEHQERVLGLADRLRADRIDAEVDQYMPRRRMVGRSGASDRSTPPTSGSARFLT
jgi:hypothetical protein